MMPVALGHRQATQPTARAYRPMMPPRPQARTRPTYARAHKIRRTGRGTGTAP